MVTYRDDILEKLKRARQEMNLTQEEFGKLLNVSRITVIRWENGQREPDLNTLAMAASIFKIDISPTIQVKNDKPDHKIYDLLKGASDNQLDFFYQLLSLVQQAPKG